MRQYFQYFIAFLFTGSFSIFSTTNFPRFYRGFLIAGDPFTWSLLFVGSVGSPGLTLLKFLSMSLLYTFYLLDDFSQFYRLLNGQPCSDSFGYILTDKPYIPGTPSSDPFGYILTNKRYIAGNLRGERSTKNIIVTVHCNKSSIRWCDAVCSIRR